MQATLECRAPLYYNEGRKRRRGAFGIVWRFGGIIQGYECPVRIKTWEFDCVFFVYLIRDK